MLCAYTRPIYQVSVYWTIGPLVQTSSPLKTTYPIKAKSYVEPSWLGGTKVCFRYPGHMTKMAAMPIYGKYTSKIFFTRTGEPISMTLGM